MSIHRFRLRSLMILVFATGLAFAGIRAVTRMTPIEWERMMAGSVLLVPFMILLGLKLGLVLAMRARRSHTEVETKPEARDEPFL